MNKFFGLIARHPILSLAVIAPIFGTLITGIIPPVVYFHPANILLNLLPVSLGAILIRDLSARWKSGWKGLILLGLAFGILRTAFFSREIFDGSINAGESVTAADFVWNIHWNMGTLLVQITALFAIILPVKLIDILSPRSRDTALLNAPGIWLCIGGLAAKVTSTFIEKSGISIPVLQVIVLGGIVLLCIAGAIFLKEKKEESGEPKKNHGIINAATGVLIIALPMLFSAFDWFAGITALIFIASVSAVGFLALYLLNNRFRNVPDFAVFFFLAGSVIFITLYQFIRDYPKFQGYIIIIFLILLFMHLVRIWLKERKDN
ncbi:MAG: hypothetical protein JW874_10195 [Spirochaetales bacterium]|nr:hypothetical protein [Spirochaetales bacterium]